MVRDIAVHMNESASCSVHWIVNGGVSRRRREFALVGNYIHGCCRRKRKKVFQSPVRGRSKQQGLWKGSVRSASLLLRGQRCLME